jgi:hypothetical protein
MARLRPTVDGCEGPITLNEERDRTLHRQPERSDEADR